VDAALKNRCVMVMTKDYVDLFKDTNGKNKLERLSRYKVEHLT